MHHLTGVVILACTATSAVAVTAHPPQAGEPDTSARAVAARAASYVADYQQAFAFLVADEHSVQLATWDAGGPTDPSRTPVRRTLRGELFLTYLGADRRWVALHDVAEVDGQPVARRDDLRAVLAVSSVQSVAARLFRHNARYNIGSITRNFNEPTLALQVLDPGNRPRFEFRTTHSERVAEITRVTLAFRERERPTLVRSLDSRPVFSRGELIVDAATGTIRRTRISFRHESIDAELDTTYDDHPRLGLWLPVLFQERYTGGPRNGLPPETITSEARYDNYRRFEVRASVVAKPR
jgi:hypothetical protein